MLKIYIDELKSSKYKAFINYAFLTSDFLSFVIDCENQVQNEFKEKLETAYLPDIMKKEFISVHPGTGTNFSYGYMITVKCNEYIKSLFMSAHCITSFDGNEFPEELCSYRNGYVWFKFISHESLIFMLNENSDDIAFLKSSKISYYYTL